MQTNKKTNPAGAAFDMANSLNYFPILRVLIRLGQLLVVLAR